MAKKRVTPQNDFDRFAENLWNKYGDEIKDIDSYNEHFDKYMEIETKPLTGNQDKILREEGFKSLSEMHKNVIKEHLPLKIVSREEEGVTELREKEKLRKAEPFEVKIRRPKFAIVASINIKHPRKGEKVGYKVVYSREITFKRKGKDITRLIDRYGRFVSKIKEE